MKIDIVRFGRALQADEKTKADYEEKARLDKERYLKQKEESLRDVRFSSLSVFCGVLVVCERSVPISFSRMLLLWVFPTQVFVCFLNVFHDPT